MPEKDPLTETMPLRTDPEPNMTASLMTEVQRALGESHLRVAAQINLPARSARFATLPDAVHPGITALLQSQYPEGVYTHQAAAIQVALDGQDLCLATSTASGKSLVFMTAAAQVLLADPHARALVLYPMRALIQDQRKKWEAMLGPLNLSAGFIDGSVPTAQRAAILRNHRMLLMTPDVAHAWLMTQLAESSVAHVLRNLRLLILDEAHVYDGVFGTNMAFFLRRLEAVSGNYRLLTSTATLVESARSLNALSPQHDHNPTPAPLADPSPAGCDPAPSDWNEIILPDQPALLDTTSGACEVRVITHLFTPKGLHYRLVHPSPTVPGQPGSKRDVTQGSA